MKIKLFLGCLLWLPLLAIAEPFMAGVDYNFTTGAAPSNVVISKNTVMEFFNPGCPACFAAESYVEEWLKHKPANVDFERVPVVFHPQWQIYAKAFYIAKAFNKDSVIIPLMFNKIHVQQEPLDTPEGLEALFIANGISKRHFENAFAGSPTLDQQLKTAVALMNAYKIYEIPTFVIAGKYYTNPSMAGNDARMLQIVTFLVKKAQTS